MQAITLIQNYETAKANEPKKRPYGAISTVVNEPATTSPEPHVSERVDFWICYNNTVGRVEARVVDDIVVLVKTGLTDQPQLTRKVKNEVRLYFNGLKEQACDAYITAWHSGATSNRDAFDIAVEMSGLDQLIEAATRKDAHTQDIVAIRSHVRAAYRN